MNKDGRLSKWERAVLAYLLPSPNIRLPRAPNITMFNLVSHGWIVRAERENDYGPERYAITPKGTAKLQDDLAKDEDNSN